jgi:murein DD-endopeptidase MepM/ murein hydrolase activator NlpD
MRRLAVISITLVALGVAACRTIPAATVTPTRTPDPAYALLQAGADATGTASAIPTVTPSPTPLILTAVLPSLTPTEEETATDEAVSAEVSETPDEDGDNETETPTPPPPTPDDGLPPDHYWLERPIPPAWTDYLDRTYAYGATAGGKYRPHTGVEFWNPVGTPVLAVGNGRVYYAGNDWENQFGPETGFYGNLIVLELSDFTYNGQAIYAVYGHLSEVYVESGQAVPVREVMGAVGGTGAANGGPHLHFEVRIGDPQSYFTSTRNPDLWIKPYYGYGSLAGRVVDAAGNYLPEVALTVTGPDMTRYAWTYAGSENIPDDEWGENFTLGDLPEGWYTVSTRSDRRTHTQEFYVRAGRTAWVEFVFD